MSVIDSNINDVLSVWSFFFGFLELALGVFVLVRAPKNRLARTWAACCFLSFFSQLGIGNSQRTHSFTEADISFRFMYVFVPWIPVVESQFLLLVAGVKRPPFIRTAYVFSSLCSVLAVFGYLVRVTTDHPPIRYFVAPQPAWMIFVVLSTIYCLYSLSVLYKKIGRSVEPERIRLKIIFYGWITASASILFQLPAIFGLGGYPWSIFMSFIPHLLMSYVIYKHQLFDFEVIIRQTFVYTVVSTALTTLSLLVVFVLVRIFNQFWPAASLSTYVLAACSVSALFHPLSRQIQNRVDDWFFRRRFERETSLIQFSRELPQARDTVQMTAALTAAITKAMQPKSMVLYLLAAHGRDYVQAACTSEAVLPSTCAFTSAWYHFFELHPAVTAAPDLDETMLENKFVVAASLRRHEALLGFILLGEKRSELAYTMDDLAWLESITNQAALIFERSKILKDITDSFIHEIKTPLTQISMPADLTVLDLQDVAEGKQSLAAINTELVNRMNYILDQVNLAVSRVDAVQQITSLEAEPLVHMNLIPVIQKTFLTLDPLIRRHAVRVDFAVPEQGLFIDGRAKQLEIIFTNLLKNAIEAITQRSAPNDAPRVAIETQMLKETIAVSITDSGPGIRPDQVHLLFKSHFTTKGSHGSGMGLYLSRQIARAHGGDIQVDLSADRGARFIVTLPLSASISANA